MPRGGKREGAGRPKADPALVAARNRVRAKRMEREREAAEIEAEAKALVSVERGDPPQAEAEPVKTPGTEVQRDYCASADEYAAKVLSGEIPACEWVKLAVQRNVRDLKRSQEDPSWPYYFDREEANRLCAVMEQFPHVKDRWAARKELLKLEPWQCWKTTVILGWRRRKNGVNLSLRRFRKVYDCEPRKNAKSTWAAALGNALLVADGVHGAEVYSGATSEKQAFEVFSPARLMWDRSPKLCRKYGVEVLARAIVRTEDNSKFWPIIGKPGDGASPSVSIHDEYHEHETSDQLDTMETGMGAREQPLLLVITTAGVNIASPCHELQEQAQKILQGVFENEEFFAIIYSIDLPQGKEGDPDYKPGDDWMDPRCLVKANPNINVSVSEEFLASQQRQAVLNPVYQNRFKTKHLNVWCSASVAGINMAQWRLAADPSLNIEEFSGEECLAILDLASKSDVCCDARLFWKMLAGKKHYYAFVRHYLPEKTIEETEYNKQAYDKWLNAGHIIATPGAEIDFDLIKEQVEADKSKFQIKEVIYDPWRATQLAHQLGKAGATVVEMGQTANNMAEAFDEFLTALKAGRFHHNGDPVLEWMASNVIARQVKKGMTMPGKDKPQNKIDGIVAIVMGISRALAMDPSGSYEDSLLNMVTA